MLTTLRERVADISVAKGIYHGAVRGAARAGLPRLWRAVNGRRHVILTFHRVRPAGQRPDPFDTCPSVSADYFRVLLEHVGERFNIVPLRELCGYTGNAHCAAITLDDGWRDNYDLAFPILRELGVPATIFVTTGKIGSSQLFWQQLLGQSFRRAIENPTSQPAEALREVLQLDENTPLTPSYYRSTVLHWKRLTLGHCDGLLTAAGCPILPSGERRYFLSADEILEMARAGVDFGSHTVTHPILPWEPDSKIERELAQSKAFLENLLGRTIDMLAYPNGQHSRAVRDCAQSLGYHLACTTRNRWLSASDDPLRLPRLESPDRDGEDLLEVPSQRSREYYLTSLCPRWRQSAGNGKGPLVTLDSGCREDEVVGCRLSVVGSNGSSAPCSPLPAPDFPLAAPDSPLPASDSTPHAARLTPRAPTHQPRAPGPDLPAPSEKIKILFLIDDFVGPEGGTEQHLLFLQRELSSDLYDLHFGVLTRIQRITVDEFPVRPVMFCVFPQSAFETVNRLRRLAAFIRTNRIDVVHAFCRNSEFFACLAVKLAGRGKVLGIRRNIGYWHTSWSRWVARFAGLLGARYAANCEAARDFAAQVEWIGRKRVTVIPNPAPTKRLMEGLANVPSRGSLGIADDEQVVGMVATVRAIKDYGTYLRAARLVLEDHPRTRFLVIGTEEPDYKAEMVQLARDLGIDRQVSWLGPMPNPLTVVPLFDVAVLSSTTEAMPNAVMEYSAAGIATVATDVGGTGEILQDGRTGFLVPPRSPNALAERIGRLLADSALRTDLGENARRRAETSFCEERILAQYARLYSRLAGTPVAVGHWEALDPAR